MFTYLGLRNSPLGCPCWSSASGYLPLGGAGLGRARVLLLWEFVELVRSVHPEMLSADSDTTQKC